MGGGRVIEITSKAQWDEHMASGKTVVVDFSAVWCGPCQMIGPYFGQLSEQYPNLTFLKVDVDSNSDISAEAGISAMPTFHVYQGGKKVKEMVGASKDKLKALIEEFNA